MLELTANYQNLILVYFIFTFVPHQQKFVAIRGRVTFCVDIMVFVTWFSQCLYSRA